MRLAYEYGIVNRPHIAVPGQPLELRATNDFSRLFINEEEDENDSDEDND
jgi:hypothetical protein